MKTKKLSKKLSLNKKNIADLNIKEIKDLHGGFGISLKCQYSDFCQPTAELDVLTCGTRCG